MKKILNLLTIAALLSSCFITCQKPEDKNVPVTGLALNKTSLTLAIGDTETLIATVLPENATNKSIKWTCSKDFIATVMPNGLVTAISEGEATIVATTKDGQFSKTCNVKVNKIHVSGVTLNKNGLMLAVGEQEKLIVTVLPANASNKAVIWTSDNPSRVSVTQDGVVKRLSAESPSYWSTTIRVTSVDNSGYYDSCEVYNK